MTDNRKRTYRIGRRTTALLLVLAMLCSMSFMEAAAAQTEDESSVRISDTETDSQTSESESQSSGDGSQEGTESQDPDIEEELPQEDDEGFADEELDYQEWKQNAKPQNNVVLLAYRTVRPQGKLTKKGGKYYYILRNGSKLTNTWLKIRKAVYYFGSDGRAWTGSHRYLGKYYYFSKKGQLYIRRFRKARGVRYYYSKTGAMIRGQWYRIKDHVYYFYSSGKMAKSCWVKGCYIKANGKLDFRKGRGSTKRYKSSGSKDRLIIIGASRVWQMSQAVLTDSNVLYIAKSGKGYRWYKRTAIPKLKKYLKKYPKSKVVIQMGNNDLTSKNVKPLYEKYAASYRSLIRSYPKAAFYFMDILPGKPLSRRKNKYAQQYNELLRLGFPKQYLGGYSYMVGKGFITSYNDSHYSVRTSRDIFNYILKKVK